MIFKDEMENDAGNHSAAKNYAHAHGEVESIMIFACIIENLGLIRMIDEDESEEEDWVHEEKPNLAAELTEYLRYLIHLGDEF